MQESQRQGEISDCANADELAATLIAVIQGGMCSRAPLASLISTGKLCGEPLLSERRSASELRDFYNPCELPS